MRSDNVRLHPLTEAMTDRETWDSVTSLVAGEFRRLPVGQRASVAAAAAAIKDCKSALHAIAVAVAVGTHCACCGGACCRSGKYHFTVVDLLVYLVDGKDLFAPDFDREGCPYLDWQGCQMAPDYRPFNCITFNCERVEGLLGPEMTERLAHLERELRGHYAALEKLFGIRLMGGLLMNGERAALHGRTAILAGNENRWITMSNDRCP